MSDAKIDSIRSSRENVRAVKEDLDDIRGAVRRGDFGVERRDAEIAAARTVVMPLTLLPSCGTILRSFCDWCVKYWANTMKICGGALIRF